ncbi:hypothetical protein FRC07_001408, partial [Ceratobasidium sp. 392]
MAQTKRPRTVKAQNATTFHNAEQLIEALRNRNPESLKNALVSFRNQITVAYGERLNMGDARLTLVTNWLEKTSGASELFDIWDMGSNYTPLVLVSLAHVISLLASTQSTIIHASTILRTLFDPTHARRLNAHLASGQTDVVLAALKVLNAAALVDQRMTFEAVAWTAKALPKLLSHRHRNPTSYPLAHPSIRTVLTTLLLALLPLSLSLDIFTALFKGLAQDDGVMVKMVLESSWEKVWCDVKVPKSLKVKVFGGLGIQPLYARTDPDSSEPFAPADVAHHFFLALCTNPGSGLCFRSKGWYPRPLEDPFEESTSHRGEDEGNEESKSGTLYNPLLLKLLRLLRPSTDARQFELAVRILGACPDLVGAYFAKGAAQIGLSLEPRLSTRWIASVGFISAVVASSVPVDSFYLEELVRSTSMRVYRAEPPPLNTIVENIVPNVLTRTWLTKALLMKSTLPTTDVTAQSSSGSLVQHTTIRLLTRCLLKLSTVLESFPSGWATCAADVVSAVRRRIPEVAVIVSTAQEAVKALREGEEGEGAKRVLLAEGALRLLWLYAQILPGAMAEVRFDVGKLLQETEVGEKGSAEMNGVRIMCQIHVLRLLGESDQFVWSAKPAGSTHTHMYRLLALHLHTPHAQLQDASANLVVKLLGSSVLFEHDPREARAWVDALPKNPEDGAEFLDFFDDVLSRCTKTPYRYLEAGNQLYARSMVNVAHTPSSLLMAVLEQLKNKPMSPPARRAIAAFVARLVRTVTGKLEVGHAKAITGYMRDIFAKEGEESGGTMVVRNLDAFLGAVELENPERMDVDSLSAPETTQLAETVESMDIGDGEFAKGRAALGILQQLRASGGQIGVREASKLVKVLLSSSTDEVILGEFLEELDMRIHSDAVLGLDEKVLPSAVSFPLAFWVFLCRGSNLTPAKALLAHSLARQPVQRLIWSCGLVLHSIGGAVRTSSQDTISDGLVALELIARRVVGTPEAIEVKQLLFGDCDAMKSLIFEPGWATYIGKIVLCLLSSSNEVDCALATTYSQYWSRRLLESKGELAAGFTIWVPFTPNQTCAQVFKASLETLTSWPSSSTSAGILLEQLAKHLRSSTIDKDTSAQLVQVLPRLIRVPAQPEYLNLQKLVPTITERELPLGLNLGLLEASASLVQLIEQARPRWAAKTKALNSISWDDFSSWIETPELVQLSTALMYLSPDARTAFSSWVGQQSSLPVCAIGPCFALMDCQAAFVRVLHDQPPLPRTIARRIVDCSTLVLFKYGERTEYQRWATRTLINAVSALPEEIDEIVRLVLKRFPSNPRDAVQQHIFSFVVWASSHSSHWEELVNLAVDSTLLWLVRRFAEDESDSPELLATLSGFESILSPASNIKAHLAEPVLVAAIKNRLDVPPVTKMCSKLVEHTSLRPASVNKLLQSIIHHPSFTLVCRTPSPSRDETIRLLRSLFYKHPSSTCHPSHIIPLLGIYRGTLDLPDTQILSIFQLFERSRQMSTVTILRNWTPDISHTQPKELLDTVCNFDPALMFRSCTSFPQRRDPEKIEHVETGRKRDIYDPNFVLPLLAALMVSDEPITSMQWVDLCRTNVLCLALSSLSSKQPAMRKLGYASLTTAYVRLVDVDFQERTQLMYTLDLLRNLLPQPSATPSDPVPRLPTYTTILLSHA